MGGACDRTAPGCTRVVTTSGSIGGGGTARVFDATNGAEICRLTHDGRVWLDALLAARDARNA